MGLLNVSFLQFISSANHSIKARFVECMTNILLTDCSIWAVDFCSSSGVTMGLLAASLFTVVLVQPDGLGIAHCETSKFGLSFNTWTYFKPNNVIPYLSAVFLALHDAVCLLRFLRKLLSLLQSRSTYTVIKMQKAGLYLLIRSFSAFYFVNADSNVQNIYVCYTLDKILIMVGYLSNLYRKV